MSRRRPAFVGSAVVALAVAVLAAVVTSADRDDAEQEVPADPVAVLDERWASPWAGIADLRGGDPGGVRFTMWESFDVACEVERGEDGRIRVGEPVPGDWGSGDTGGPTLTLGVDDAMWTLARGPVLRVESGGEVVEVPVPVQGQPSGTWGPGGLVQADDGTVWFAVGQYRTHTIEWVVGHVADGAPDEVRAVGELGGRCSERSATTVPRPGAPDPTTSPPTTEGPDD